MIRLRLTIFGLLALAAIAIGVISVVPKSHGLSKSVPKIEAFGLPEHGLSLVGPKDSAFEKLMAAHLQQTSLTKMNTAEAVSVFVVNNNNQSVAACNVKFEVVSPDGQIVTHSRAHSATLTTVSDRALLMEDIGPRGNRLVSLLDLPPPGIHLSTGGGSGIANQLSESTIVTASLDGVLFVDGTFVGPDTMNYFPRLRAEVEASTDLNTEIAKLMDNSVGPEAVINRIEAVAHTQLDGAPQPRGKDPNYLMMRTRYASRLLGMRKARGDRVVFDFVRAEADKPHVSLRKL